MLEAGGVGGVTGDGNLNALSLHDGNTLQNVVGAVALDSSALAVGVGDGLDDLELAGGEVIVGLDVGEAVDTADDLGSVLAQAVQDDAQGLLADLVGGTGNADSALSGGEGLVAGQEGEAMGVLMQQHGTQVAVAQTDLALLSDRAGDGEGLEALADGSCTVGSALQAALNGNGGAQGVCPDSIVEADGLDAADDLIAVDALGQQHLVAGVEALQAVGLQAGLDLGHTAILGFKSCHNLCSSLSYSSRGSMYLTAPCSAEKRP